MASPSMALTNFRPDLGGSFTEFNLEADRQGFIAPRVLPVFETPKVSGAIPRIPLEQLLQNRETLRAPKSGYSRGDWTFEELSYVCREHGAEEVVDANLAAMYKDFFDAEVISGGRARDAVLRNHERAIAQMVFDTTTWTGAALTTGVGTAWTNHANATPVANVNGARNKVWEGTGLWPNALILTRHAFNELRQCEEIIDLIASQGAGSATKARDITTAQLAAVFDLDHILVAGGAQNTADKGQSRSIASIWSNTMAMVARIAETNDIQEPCLGRTFHWGEDGSTIGATMESYESPDVRGEVIRARHQKDDVILYKEAGHLLTGVMS